MTVQVTATRAEALAAARREATEASHARSHRKRRPGVVVRDIVIALAGIAGVLVIAWTVLSRVLGLSLVVLMTGSMSPTLPTGSVAIVLDQVPAADLHVGDVIKVPRPGYDLPVTHRIVSVGAVTGQVTQLSTGVDPADPGARELVLKGDANESADPSPYVVTQADRVVIGAPYLGYVNQILHMPIVLMAIGGALLLLFIGTSLPSRRPNGSRASGGAPAAAIRAAVVADVTPPEPVRSGAHSAGRGRSRSRRAAAHSTSGDAVAVPAISAPVADVPVAKSPAPPRVMVAAPPAVAPATSRRLARQAEAAASAAAAAAEEAAAAAEVRASAPATAVASTSASAGGLRPRDRSRRSARHAR